MIDLETIQDQINSLQICVSNCNDAERQVEHVKHRRGLYDYQSEWHNDLIVANKVLRTTENTLVGQLRLMNYQNEKLLKLKR